MAAQQQAASVLQSFPFRVAVLVLCVALLPLLPAAPEAGGAGAAGQAFLAKACELLHLLFVGIAVSYGLFSRKNSADDGRTGVAAAAAKDAAAGPEPAKADARYAWRMFRDSIAPFDDDDEEELPDSPLPGGGGREKMRSWSALHRPEDPVVVVSNGGGERSGHAVDRQAPLSLPVRTLKPQSARDASAGGGETPHARPRRGSQDSATGGIRDETVLPSPIPWRSRSGRLDAGRPASPSPSPSPKTLSPSSSLSRETLAKASEEYYAKRRSPYRSSSISSPPPAPPPPPPPFLVHGYHPATERRTAAAKSFKEELQDNSKRGPEEDHYSPNTSIFSTSAYSSSNSSTPKPRNSFDGGGSSSSASVGKSVRTIRTRDPAAAFQGQSQELSDDADDGRDTLGVQGLEESYDRAYQSIPRFQYERSVSDPILGGVAVSSDDTESSDDDDVGAYSTRTNSPRESTPEVDENEVDKKAEEFIARFREQIRRQRIESIKKSAGPHGVKHHGK
ncbi:hypothetical protein BAE44_0010520 [Dichanthelium oligosanthes]|uniref:DUF4408 domain-containing protein n=1 Tax=Dichanthelium oligosanthes TaxID=888268 RepID=A0A1E5VTN7_9POAL|nr:hypothetical protein BAE44_0010520 [Dichanthelium oligosanthes]